MSARTSTVFPRPISSARIPPLGEGGAGKKTDENLDNKSFLNHAPHDEAAL